MNIRPRRLRASASLRNLVAETRLSKEMFVQPYFVVPGTGVRKDIPALPGMAHLSPDELVKDTAGALKSGLNKVLLFGSGEAKTDDGASAYNEKSVVAQAVRALKEEFGTDILVITDVCICAYTSHGHCGIMADGRLDNDASLPVIADMALAHAKAGADIVAPSDMMDGRVAAIRETLDAHRLQNTAIMSYAVKYASAYYGPFREAAGSAPSSGDRKTYQMDVRNLREAVKEAQLDEREGADILMVKPALAFLDVIREVRRNTGLPLACYNVSGEYAMVKAAAAQGVLDERSIVMENMTAFARAGADIIITYHAGEILKKGWLAG